MEINYIAGCVALLAASVSLASITYAFGYSQGRLDERDQSGATDARVMDDDPPKQFGDAEVKR